MSDIPMFVAQTILTPKFSVKLQFCGVLKSVFSWRIARVFRVFFPLNTSFCLWIEFSSIPHFCWWTRNYCWWMLVKYYQKHRVLPSWRFCTDKTTLFVDQTSSHHGTSSGHRSFAQELLTSNFWQSRREKRCAAMDGMGYGWNGVPHFQTRIVHLGMDGWVGGWIDSVYFWTALDRVTGHCQVCKSSFCFTCIMFCDTIPFLQRRIICHTYMLHHPPSRNWLHLTPEQPEHSGNQPWLADCRPLYLDGAAKGGAQVKNGPGWAFPKDQGNLMELIPQRWW